MHVRRLPAFTIAMALVALGGCSSDAENSSQVQSAIIGGFTLRLNANRLDVLAPDGRVLLEGLGPGTIIDTDVPHAGFAVRDITESYEMQFGAFRPTDEAHGPWRLGHELRLQQAPDGAAVVVGDEAGQTLVTLSFTAPEQGHLRVQLAPGDGPERRFSWGYNCRDDDHFIGFGSQAWDVDHRGQTVPTFVQEQGIGKDPHDEFTGLWMVVGRRHSSHIPIPQYLASRGYMLTTETQLRSTFALCSEDASVARVEMTMPGVIHLFDGPSPTEAIERATATFGRPRMPPRFAFAPWNDAIFGSENVRRVAAKLREHNVPSSVIWSEDWAGAEEDGDAYKLSEEWEVDRALYPDFEQLADDLHRQGFKFFVYFNTFVYEGTSAWDETASRGWLVRTTSGQPYVFQGGKLSSTGLLDLTHPEARDWAAGKLRDAVDLGADGWMGDFAEWMPTDGLTHAGPSLDQHNDYPIAWQRVQREVLDSVNDGVDRLFFARSGWFGTPQLADVVWAGDQRTSFQEDDGLPTIMPIGIGLGVVGVSTYGHDIAGYQSSTNEAADKELFFRWTELGAYSPVMRTHHGYQAKKNWSWESDDETIEHFARYARIHIAMTPFWEGLARIAADTGVPIWRGLALRYPQEPAVWPIKDQVMIGDAMMIAPVVTRGARSRSVYLPGDDWYLWDEASGPRAGGTSVEVQVPLDEIAVFARAGAVVPMYPDGVMTLANSSAEVPGPESVGDNRVVHVFLGASGAFQEAGGLRYELVQHESATQDRAGAASYAWQGQQLSECATASATGCVQSEGARRDLVRVQGPGTLVIHANGQPLAEVRATGGSEDRLLTFDVRR